MTMGLLSGIAAAAGAGAEILGDRIKKQDDEAVQTRRDVRLSDLDLKRARAVEEMRREFNVAESDRLRTQSKTDAEAVTAGATASVGERMKDHQVEDPSTWTTEQEAVRNQGIQGLIGASKEDVARRMGLTGLANEYAASQERKDRAEERLVTSNRADRSELRLEKRNEIQDTFNNRRADIQDRLAAVAEGRMGRMEKNQSLQMDKAELQSTRLSLTSVLTDISKEADRIQVLRGSSMGDKATNDLYDKQLETLRKDQTTARTRLNELAGILPPPIDAAKPLDREVVGPGGVRMKESEVAAYVAKQAEEAAANKKTSAEASAGPKLGDTRTVAIGRGQGSKTQVYVATGRGGSGRGWQDQ